MVVNKIVNATQLDADLTDIADAIREKSGTSATLEFPEDFVTAIDAIPSGGGASLPSIISALAGGSFTLSESARCNTQQIQHGMAAVPKGFFIWSDDAFTETGTGDGTMYYESGYFSIIDTQNANGAFAGYFVCQYRRQSDMRVGVNNGLRTSAQISGYVNATSICMISSNESFQAGKTYKWLAWA